MESNGTQFKSGLKDGIPIGLGYLAVSFTFGIMASGAGLNTWQAVVMSFTNLTSAGQFAALGIIQAGAPFVEMAAAQLIINLRYCLMSCSLSQKLKAGLPFFHRFLISYGVTACSWPWSYHLQRAARSLPGSSLYPWRSAGCLPGYRR